MKDSMDKSLFFLTVALICVWLIVDMAVGKNYLGNFLTIIFPFMDSDTGTGEMTEEQIEEAQKNAPASSAMGSGGSFSKGAGGSRGDSSVPGSLPYGAKRSE